MLFNKFNKIHIEESTEVINKMINDFYFSNILQKNENKDQFNLDKDLVNKLKEIFSLYLINSPKFVRPSSIEKKSKQIISNPVLSTRNICSANVNLNNYFVKEKERTHIKIPHFILPPLSDDFGNTIKKTTRF